jgi:translocation and assembly module TamB
MPVDEHDERSTPSSTEQTGNAAATPPPPSPLPPAPDAPTARRRHGWRRVVNRRNAMWTAIAAVVALALIVLVAVFLYRSGQIDRIIARQIVSTMARYGIRAEIGSFETKFGPRTAELRDVRMYDAETGAQLGKIERLVATVRIEDMWALSLRRNVNLEALEINGLEAWVTYDEQGRSNFANLHLPPPEPNSRILFAYSTARITLNSAVIHYDDQRHELSGEARNLRATITPDDPNAPEESRMNRVELAFSDSTFVYDGRPVNQISVEARARVNQTRAEIQELILRSPVAEARLEGTMDDWRNLRYQTRATASIDLTQLSDVLQPATTLRGTGRFEGTINGEGERYTVDGEITSDALAADGVRLKALTVNASGTGQGNSYEAQGRAVAELLTAGDFQLNAVQLAGGVVGTGTDFRWIGELRTAALRSGATSVATLVLRDAVAEMREGRLTGGAKTASAGSINSEGASVRGASASGVEFARDENGETRVSATSASAGTVTAEGATVGGVNANGIRANISPDGRTNVEVAQARVGGLQAQGVRTGTINVAGVRLAIYEGRVEATSNDINVGMVAFKTDGGRGAADGRADGVRLARPRFVLEPGGGYRASADLSLGGGVLGEMKLGSARSAVVATNNELRLVDFVAEIFGGRARGNATINTAGGASRVVSDFEGLDVGGLAAVASGRTVPVTGAATGRVNLSFPGTNFKAASGTLDAQFAGETGREESARTPVTGELALDAQRGLFQIRRASLRTGATELNATGQFSFAGDSNLSVNLASTDASELQRVVVASGLLPAEMEDRLNNFGVELAGRLDFNGTLTGALADPLVNGRASVGALTLRGRNLGALSADIASNAAEVRINNGRLAEPDGGGATFTAVIPRVGTDNITLDATLERANAGNILAALGGAPGAEGDNAGGGAFARSLAGMGAASGRVQVAGLPGAMSGSADLRIAAGRIGNEPYEEITARATFAGSRVNIENFDARFATGHVVASGNLDVRTFDFDLRARGDNVRLDLLGGLAAGRAPALGGLADFTATASGNLNDQRSYRVELDARGRDVTVNGQPAGELTLTGRTTADNRFTLELTTGLLGRPQVIRAEVDLASEALATTVETTLTGTDLTPLFQALMPDSDVRVTGRATGTLRARGDLFDEGGAFSLAALQGRAEFTELVVQIEDVPLVAANPLVILFSPNQITFEQTRFTGPNTNLRFGGTAAIGAGGTQNLTVEGDLNLRILNTPNVFLAGVAHANVRVAGTFEDPRITGTAAVSNASFATLITDERLQISNINGSVRFDSNRAQIDNLTGRMGGGRIAVSGGTLLAGFRPSQFSFAVRGDNVTVPFPDNFRSTADANLELRGTFESQILEGNVNLRRTEYTEDIDLADFINRRAEGTIEEAGDGGAGGLLSNLTLDLQIEGRDALVVRNNLADAVGSISLRVRGPREDPVVSGRITATRGTLNFRRDRYEISRAIVDLPSRRDADPVVNIQAESEIRGYRVTVGINGPLSQPTTTLRSDPALPQADVVALITTGNLSGGEDGRSTLAQTGLGTATSLLTEQLFNAPVRRATDKLFGLNRFELDPMIAGRGGASPTARLTVGRQINRNLSVTYSTNVTGEQQQVVALEYRVSDRLSFVAQYQQGSQNTLRTQNNNFNFEIRFRKRY